LEEVNSHDRPSLVVGAVVRAVAGLGVGEDRSTPSVVTLCAAAAQHMIYFAQLMQERKVTAPA
jgi:hypothetical protein